MTAPPTLKKKTNRLTFSAFLAPLLPQERNTSVTPSIRCWLKLQLIFPWAVVIAAAAWSQKSHAVSRFIPFKDVCLLAVQEKSDYFQLSAVIKDFEPYYSLWTTANDWLNWYHSWMNDPFTNLDPEQMEKGLDPRRPDGQAKAYGPRWGSEGCASANTVGLAFETAAKPPPKKGRSGRCAHFCIAPY